MVVILVLDKVINMNKSPKHVRINKLEVQIITSFWVKIR